MTGFVLQGHCYAVTVIGRAVSSQFDALGEIPIEKSLKFFS